MKLIYFIALFLHLFLQPVLSKSLNKTTGSNLHPFSFGSDQSIIDLNKVIWKPLIVKGLPSGAKIALLRGSLETGTSESLLKLSHGYYMPVHNHTSDELYIWLSGAFTLIAHDKTELEFDGSAYISFPGNAPPHGLKCGLKESCILYLKLSRPFDIRYFPATQKKPD